jgi:hypothetical protein
LVAASAGNPEGVENNVRGLTRCLVGCRGAALHLLPDPTGPPSLRAIWRGGPRARGRDPRSSSPTEGSFPEGRSSEPAARGPSLWPRLPPAPARALGLLPRQAPDDPSLAPGNGQTQNGPSEGSLGPPADIPQVRELIFHLARENPRWGAEDSGDRSSHTHEFSVASLGPSRRGRIRAEVPELSGRSRVVIHSIRCGHIPCQEVA